MAFIYCFCNGEVKKKPAVYFWRVKSGSFNFLLVCFKICFPFFFLLFCSQVQAEVKKAWVRRSLTQDLKQKSRMTSSGGGGSSYYGGMMSHSTTHGASVSAANPRSFPIGGVVGPGGPTGLRFSRHSSLCPQTDLPYTPGDAESSSPQQELTLQKPVGMESGICARHARTSKGNLDPKSQEAQRLGAEEPDSSLSLKELETSLWLFYSDMLLCICKYWDWWPLRLFLQLLQVCQSLGCCWQTALEVKFCNSSSNTFCWSKSCDMFKNPQYIERTRCLDC